MAHAIFEDLIKQKGIEEEWEVDSAAIGSWHVGNQPERRALKVLKEKGITFSHPVRQVFPHRLIVINLLWRKREGNFIQVLTTIL